MTGSPHVGRKEPLHFEYTSMYTITMKIFSSNGTTSMKTFSSLTNGSYNMASYTNKSTDDHIRAFLNFLVVSSIE